MKNEIMRNKTLYIKIRAIEKVLISVGIMFLILFIVTKRFDYWQGWIYFGLFFYLDVLIWVVVPKDLRQERILIKPDSKKWDLPIYYITAFLSYIIPLVAALDGGRNHWSGQFPIWVNISAFLLIFLGYTLTIFSLWKNQFFSTVVRIQKDRDHYVIDKGPYAYIRHPGYTGLIVSTFSIGFSLNSYWAFIPGSCFCIFLIIRTYLEDMTLQNELEGYKDYTKRVKYRLFPLIW